ncbi:hypothetical protein BCR44DRAFT_1428847 [Catenaria anguillulae PL171]|uniref:Uncharacterized protein n=1 Tax=Catenaria anguillulae PL171 TaxID=765915 RepID=A0A1Y2HW60_9FUNG|nr:hypothetical protein BCR44DRAFT_1428847 [Catenaria anguillulae PL171]
MPVKVAAHEVELARFSRGSRCDLSGSKQGYGEKREKMHHGDDDDDVDVGD